MINRYAGLDCFLNFTGSEATCTNFYFLLLAADQGLDLNQIGFPDSSGFVMCMADIIAAYSSFSTYITFTGHYIPTFACILGL